MLRHVLKKIFPWAFKPTPLCEHCFKRGYCVMRPCQLHEGL